MRQTASELPHRPPPAHAGGTLAKRAVIYGIAAVLGIVLLAFAFYTYPAPTMDSSTFVPPAISFEAGHGLVNKVRTFLYPAPLFPLVLSALMWEPTPQSAYIVLGFLGVLNIALCALLFRQAATLGYGRLTWFGVLLAALSLVSVAVRFGDGSLRPEIFASLLVLTAALAVLYWRPAWPEWPLWVLHGLTLALMAAAHPNGALLFAPLLGVLYAARFRPGAALYRLTWVYGSASALFALALWVSPYGVVEAVKRMLRVGEHVSVVPGELAAQWAFTDYYVLHPMAFLFGVVFLFALAGAAHLLKRHWHKVGAPVLVLLSVGAFLGLAYFTAVRVPKRSYNLFLFAPLFFAGAVYYAERLRRHRARPFRLLGVAYAGLLALTTLSFGRTLVLFFVYLQAGTSLTEARLAFEQVSEASASAEQTVMVTKAMWTLTEEYDTITFCPTPPNCGEADNVLVIQQQHSGRATPKAMLNGRPLVQDRFVNATPRFLGIKIANSMPGYGFAVYGPQQQPALNASESSGSGAEAAPR